MCNFGVVAETLRPAVVGLRLMRGAPTFHVGAEAALRAEARSESEEDALCVDSSEGREGLVVGGGSRLDDLGGNLGSGAVAR